MVNYILEIESENNEIKEYEFHSEELGSLNGVQDEILIENGELSIIKKIGITKEFLFYVLETPVKTKIDLEESIELFEGSNTLKIKDLNGNYIITYLLVNDSVDMLATKKEVASTIALLDNQITLKVDKEDVISQINQSSEKVTINSNKIKLEGHTTINDGFSVDLDGNMSCRDANINNLVNKSGIYTTLRFDHSKKEAWEKELMFKGFVGYLDSYYMENGKEQKIKGKRAPMYVNYSIPDNYVVDLAYLIIGHQSVSIGEFSNVRVKDIELYIHELNKAESVGIGAQDIQEPNQFPQRDFYIGDRIDNAWGSGVHSYTFPVGNRRKRTANISDTINEVRQGIIAIAPRKKTEELQDIPGAEYEYSAFMSATLYIYGYLDKKE